VITVNKLTKVYTGHDKTSLTALKNISFKLPDKGLVFITGKSGSGKSTLLNMLGGLDSITKGDIIADGNKFSAFSSSDFDKFRNSYIGFVFQDYCLLDDLTVYQNIELVLDLNQRKDKSIIKYILDKVHLSNCENRYPRELSGGQKQRVAIARALAKDPHVILADEPTGNLDSKTAKQIMKILKELSKTTLVVVVSHNIEDAELYGDRILELADGVIIRDEEKMVGYEDRLELINGRLILPRHKDLSEDEIKQINKWQKNSEVVSVEQRQSGFYPSSNDIDSNKFVPTHKSKLSFAKSFALAGVFLKRRRLSYIVTSLIVTLIVAVLGVCQFFVQFDYCKAINKAVATENRNVVVGYKSRYIDEDLKVFNTSFIYDMLPSDYQSIKKSKYDGNVYSLYNDAISVTGASNLLRQEIRLYAPKNLANFYLLETYGTLVCNEQYLCNSLGVDQIKYIGDPLAKTYGIVITDYVADSIIYYSDGEYIDYNDILGLKYEGNGNYNHYINAIIDTDYESLFAGIKASIMREYEMYVSKGQSSNIYNTPKFLEFADYVEKYLGVSYSFNPNYYEDYVSSNSKSYSRLDYTNISSKDSEFSNYFESMTVYEDIANSYLNTSLGGAEIAMSTYTYNTIFGTNYNADNLDTYLGTTEVKLKKYYRFDTENTDPKYTNSCYITKLFDAGKQNSIIVNSDNFDAIRRVENFDYAIYLDGVDCIGYTYDVTRDCAISMDSSAYNSVSSIVEVVDIFEGFFNIITVVLYTAILLLLVNFGAGNIRRRKFEIGVMKAMGGQTAQVGKIFVIQIISVGLVVCLLSTIATIALSNMVNSVLATSMLYFIKNETLTTISIIQINPLILVLDIVFILIISIISAIIPLIKLSKIKPINIIKHKN